MSFRFAADLNDFWEGEMKSVRVGSENILLIHLRDGVRAYRDACKHQKFKMSVGKLEGHQLTCAAHQWSYDASTGQGINPKGIALHAFAVKVEDGKIFVNLEDHENDE